ncbi:TetR/AcrR family transcriptional regulator [Micromonospora sp. BQ11]|uniref:TetR/AcrR family transcriptional regulator n=1 Tax=Micromonospora sp. BQ11 TaxID=3452212 RepID=UPI003F8A80AB
MDAEDVTGRRLSARGRHRRDLLLDAAGEVLMTQGFAALSHRAVAQQADLPLAATTYYFKTLDELVTEAVQRLADRWLATAREAVDRLPRTLDHPGATAEAVLDVVTLTPAGAMPAEPGRLLTLYGRYLEAARHPGLRPVIDRYNDAIDDLLREILRRGGLTASLDDARLVLAVVDGALPRALAAGQPVAAVRAPVERLLRALPGATSS